MTPEEKKKQVRLTKLLDKLWHHLDDLHYHLDNACDMMEEDTVDDVYGIGLAQKEVRTLLRSLSKQVNKEMTSAQRVRRHRVRENHPATENLVYSMSRPRDFPSDHVHSTVALGLTVRRQGEF